MGKRPGPAPRVCIVAPDLVKHLTDISALAPDPANAREHGPESIDAIRASLQRFGQQKPVVVDARGVVIAGNGLLEAARTLGWTHIAAVRSDLGGVERVAYAIADNKIPELSSWNEGNLGALLSEMPRDAALAAGFTEAELREITQARGDESIAEDAPPDPLPPAVTRTGDLWELGTHRLLCGDSTEDTDVDRLMDGRRAALVATDPPYLVDYTGERVGGQGKDWSAHYREVEIADAGAFFDAVFANVVRVMAPNAAVYCWHAHKRVVEIIAAWRKVGLLDHQQVIWIKPTPVFGSVFWHFRHEPALMGWLQGSKPPHDGRHDHDSVWVAPGTHLPLEQLTKAQLIQLVKDASTAWEIDWEGKGRPVGNEHPTQKPIEIFARPMRKHTKAGDVVFEPFSGSGSQIMAAEQLGRACCAMELEPAFCDVAIRRWQKATGHTARLAGDGRTWAQIAQDRGVSTEGTPCRPDPSAPAATQAVAS